MGGKVHVKIASGRGRGQGCPASGLSRPATQSMLPFGLCGFLFALFFAKNKQAVSGCLEKGMKSFLKPTQLKTSAMAGKAACSCSALLPALGQPATSARRADGPEATRARQK